MGEGVRRGTIRLLLPDAEPERFHFPSQLRPFRLKDRRLIDWRQTYQILVLPLVHAYLSW